MYENNNKVHTYYTYIYMYNALEKVIMFIGAY